jgi:raffinose/stachyose/melibiose transport system substrate-binding protein
LRGVRAVHPFVHRLTHARRGAVWAALCLVLLSLTACWPQTTGSLQIWYATDDPVEHQWAIQLVDLFNRSHPNVHATISVYGYDDFNPKLLAALGAGNPPDLAYATPRVCGIPKYVQNHKLVDLTSAARRLGWAAKLRPGLLQDYNSPFTIFATKRYGVQPTNVQVYAVPDSMAAVAVMYNASLLKQLGLSVPQTLAQFSADVTIASDHHLVPLGLGDADGFLGDDWYQTMVNTKLPYVDLERELRISSDFSFERPPFVWASAQLLAWRNDFTANSGSIDAQDGVRQFFQGRTLFQLISSSEDSQITSLMKLVHFQVGVFGFPGAKPNDGVMPQSGYEGWIIPKQGHDTTNAITFINWILSPSTQRFLLRQGAIPATPVSSQQARTASPFLRQYLGLLASLRPGVFLDAAPILNLNATMEGNVQLMLNVHEILEGPHFLPNAMQLLYREHGRSNETPVQIDCEF